MNTLHQNRRDLLQAVGAMAAATAGLGLGACAQPPATPRDNYVRYSRGTAPPATGLYFVPDAAARQRILVDNAVKLYQFT